MHWKKRHKGNTQCYVFSYLILNVTFSAETLQHLVFAVCLFFFRVAEATEVTM